MYPSTKVRLPNAQDQSDNLLHFSLQSALPQGHVLVLNTTSGVISYMGMLDGNLPMMLAQEQLTNTEASVLLPLLEMFPYFCPYEVLYARFYNPAATDADVERYRDTLHKAKEKGVWDQEFRPVRGALSRARLKLRPFGIDVTSIIETGYILMIESVV